MEKLRKVTTGSRPYVCPTGSRAVDQIIRPSSSGKIKVLVVIGHYNTQKAIEGGIRDVENVSFCDGEAVRVNTSSLGDKSQDECISVIITSSNAIRDVHL